ncbi:MAG: Tfp pilus assembly protein FimT/FimU [Thermodesulfobacteriota bacterium]
MKNKGVTLLELMIALSIVGILVALTAPAFLSEWLREGDVKTSVRGLFDDLKWAQAEAQKQGSVMLSGGTLQRRAVFFVFNEAGNSYSIWRWQDEDGDIMPEDGELDPDLDNISFGAQDNAVKTESLEDGVSFGFGSGVDDACRNDGNSTGAPFSTTIVAPSYPPCSGSPCIQFDAKGFMKGQPNKVIYITDNKYSYAIAGNLAGIFRMCEWVDNEWRMTRG